MFNKIASLGLFRIDCLAAIFSLFVISGCIVTAHSNDSVEAAVSPNTIITLTDQNRDMRIKGEGLFVRSYISIGHTNTVTLSPRNKRYYGSRGLTYSGAWDGERGINRAIVNEGQQHFCSEYEALFWLSHGWNNSSGIDLVYTQDGLAVGYVETVQRRQINIDVWQVYINGKKPESLKGASPKKISVLHNADVVAPESYYSSYKPHMPSTINGVVYSGRALDMLTELKYISTQNIETVLKHGKKRAFEDAYIYDDTDETGKGIRIVVDSAGMVMDVYP